MGEAPWLSWAPGCGSRACSPGEQLSCTRGCASSQATLPQGMLAAALCQPSEKKSPELLQPERSASGWGWQKKG